MLQLFVVLVALVVGSNASPLATCPSNFCAVSYIDRLSKLINDKDGVSLDCVSDQIIQQCFGTSNTKGSCKIEERPCKYLTGDLKVMYRISNKLCKSVCEVQDEVPSLEMKCEALVCHLQCIYNSIDDHEAGQGKDYAQGVCNALHELRKHTSSLNDNFPSSCLALIHLSVC